MKRKNLNTIIFTCLLLVALVTVNNWFNLDFGGRLTSTFRPVGIVLNQAGVGISSFFGNIKNIGRLQKDNKELNDKLNVALAELARLNEAQKENSALKRDLGFKEETNYNLVAANVISFDPTNIRESITISAGKNDGLKEGDTVISEGFLIGKVMSVSPSTSKIRLISDSESAIPATLSNSSVTGIVKGRIGAGMTLEQVPQSEKVMVGDSVVTSGLGGEYIKGLVIGKVEEIQKISGSIFQLISIRPMVDLNKLERVMIIKG